MELKQEHMDAYTSGSTKGGELDWNERDDRLGIQAVLDLLAPGPADRLKTAERQSMELTRTRTILSGADTAHERVRLRQSPLVSELLPRDPEALLMLQALDTVREVLRPWARAGWQQGGKRR